MPNEDVFGLYRNGDDITLVSGVYTSPNGTDFIMHQENGVGRSELLEINLFMKYYSRVGILLESE